MHKKKQLISMVVLVLLMTGCWDKVEIEERAFVAAIGIDKYVPSQEDEELYNVQDELYEFTFLIPDESFAIGKGGKRADIILSSVSDAIFIGRRQLATRSNRSLFFGHLQVLVIGSDVAENPKMMRQILDAFEREEVISRKVSIVIAEGNAKEVLSVKPLLHPVTGEFISDIFKRKDRTPRAPRGVINEVFQSLHESGNALIPRIIPAETDLRVAGAAIIKDYKLEGWLDEIATRALMLVRGEIPMAGMEISYHDRTIPFNVVPKSHRFRLVRDGQDGGITVVIELEVESDIEQFYFNPNKDILDTEMLNEISNILGKKMEEEAHDMIRKLQKEFKVDVIGINRYLRQYHYKLWKEIERDWDEIFPNITIKVNIDNYIRRIGLTK